MQIPTQAEFISSNTAPTLQAKFDAWIASGQNHIGNQLVGSSVENSLYAYVFCVRNLEQNHLTTGILLTSRDSKHRRYPFIIFGAAVPASKNHSITPESSDPTICQPR